MIVHSRTLGIYGEKRAVQYLSSRGYRIHDVNFSTKGGEIDIVAEKNGTYIFCEVKARIGESRGKPYEAVTAWKLKHLLRAINYYKLIKNLHDVPMRIDVVSIVFNPDYSIQKFQHFENVGMW